MKKILNVFLMFSLMLGLLGCQSFGRKFKDFLNNGKKTPKKIVAKKPQRSFSSHPNYYKAPHRKYKRTTRETLANENQLASRSGSLWIMEGQGSYLFSQNIMRMIGDPIAIRIEGEPRQQLESKSNVIKELIEKLKVRKQSRARRLASAKKAAAARAKGATAAPTATAKEEKSASTAGQKKRASAFSIQSVPTRIVERLVDGNYRVKGSQPFLIGQREYKTIVTGVVRAEDFSEDGISATKLIDPKFDIVSSRRGSVQ